LGDRANPRAPWRNRRRQCAAALGDFLDRHVDLPDAAVQVRNVCLCLDTGAEGTCCSVAAALEVAVRLGGILSAQCSNSPGQRA
jgi:hypothetical protein